MASTCIQRGSFVGEYSGELITEREAKRRENADKEDCSVYRQFFKWNNKNYW